MLDHLGMRGHPRGVPAAGAEALPARDAVETADVVVLLSHNGLPADLKMAGRVRGIDVILGGHTHEGLPEPVRVGGTLVVNPRGGSIQIERATSCGIRAAYVP